MQTQVYINANTNRLTHSKNYTHKHLHTNRYTHTNTNTPTPTRKHKQTLRPIQDVLVKGINFLISIKQSKKLNRKRVL